jgi:dUTP pyrophosphatase
MKVELQILDPRLPGWGFPSWGSSLAAGLDLHACLDGPLTIEPQMPAVLISAGIAFRIGDPDWCALVLPRSGLGHRAGLVLGNAVGLIDADYAGPCLISAWNRNPPHSGAAITCDPATASPSSSSPGPHGRNSRSSRLFPNRAKIIARPRPAAPRDSARPASAPLVLDAFRDETDRPIP